RRIVADAPMLEVNALTKRFGGLVAVKNLSFAIRGGEILGLIGPNGSGKSTAMRSVMGVDPPTSGSVRFEGREIAGLPSHKVARMGVGLVFQHSRPLMRQTVLENIKVALIPEFRSEGRAVLLVDHNVKSVAALVDRAVAMYLGEKIAEGTAAEVMRDETVRRVYLGGALTRAETGNGRAATGAPLLEVKDV